MLCTTMCHDYWELAGASPDRGLRSGLCVAVPELGRRMGVLPERDGRAHACAPVPLPQLRFIRGLFQGCSSVFGARLGSSSAGCAVHKINVPVTVQGEAVPMGHQ